MKTLLNILTLILCLSNPASGEDIPSMIEDVDLGRLVTMVRQFSGEDSTYLNGDSVRILSRVNNSPGNILAGDYIKEQLSQYDLEVEDIAYSDKGRNIVATQEGSLYPDSIYMVCAHYDSRANYCADDNASGTVAVIEIARILSAYCFKNTIVYALWDEEEIGLKGSRNYANAASANGDAIVGVLNMDMIAYDSNNDMKFDIDVRDIHGSNAIATLLDTLVTVYSLNLETIIFRPGTYGSDHASFWNNNYAAVLLGESWATDDENEFYHTSNDRISEFNLPYFHELAKLSLAWTATVAELIATDNTVSVDGSTLTAEMTSPSYQWVDCDDGFSDLEGETQQSFTATENGNYAVEVTIGDCTDRSSCENIIVTSTNDLLAKNSISIYPNPVIDRLTIELDQNIVMNESVQIIVSNQAGQQILRFPLIGKSMNISTEALAPGMYFIEIRSGNAHGWQEFIKL
ncbi:MAG: M28 family peptidase [Bacteroidetes bacterium]|nr:M28 family peptidase [Bacteroidota bacterium]